MAIACLQGYLVSRSSKRHVGAVGVVGAITTRFGWQVDSSSENVSVAEGPTAAGVFPVNESMRF